MKSRTLLAFLPFCLCATPVLAQASTGGDVPVAARPETVMASRLENVAIHAPDGTPKALVVYLSDRSGWTSADDSIVDAMRAGGSVVLAVDFARYAARLDQSDGECLYVVGEITDLAQTAERQLDIQTYLPPIVVGSGEGATFAYAALADAPDNTLGGAVASGFGNKLGLRLPFCPGANSTKAADGHGYSYGFDKDLPGAAYLFVDASNADTVGSEAQARDRITVDALDAGNEAQQVAQAVAELADAAKPFGDLPAIDLPASRDPSALAILVSGDGGWRDLDKSIGEWLSNKDVHVVGLDALHYFWSKRTPQELADDIASIVEKADPDQKLPVLLIGYSFGADTIPFAYPLLPKSLKDRTKRVALLAPGLTTSFQVTVSGWLGIDDSGYEVVPAIAAIPANRVLCFYGKEEDDSACADSRLAGFERIETEGGHHFDGDYEALSAKIFGSIANR